MHAGKPKFLSSNIGLKKGEGIISLKSARHPVFEKINPHFVPVYFSY